MRLLVVAINKMDDPTVKWSEQRFRECEEKLTPFLKVRALASLAPATTCKIGPKHGLESWGHGARTKRQHGFQTRLPGSRASSLEP